MGKRDGQLLYPNRVAVVASSGEIVVTERSPTHQVNFLATLVDKLVNNQIFGYKSLKCEMFYKLVSRDALG